MLAMPAMAAPSQEEMWKIIQQQQQQIEALQKQLLQQQTQLRETEVKVEATATAVETNATAPAAASWAANTTIGGYAEMHYNNWENQNDAPGAEDRNEIDFHRFVVFLGHQFNDRLRFFSEIELEHSIAGDDQNGEVELEQAYIEYDLNSAHRAKAGLFLVPVGIINETHEPDTFYGVERNSVENKIIPTTVWLWVAKSCRVLAMTWR